MCKKVCLVAVLMVAWLTSSTSSFAEGEPVPSTPIPIESTAINPDPSDNALVIHSMDPAAGQDIIQPLPVASPDHPEIQNANFAPPLEEQVPAADLAVPDGPDAFGAQVEVGNTQVLPYQMNAMVAVTWPSGASYTCSGVLIDQKLLLTAAHCVYTWNPAYCTGGNPKCWASSVSVAPGYRYGAYPYGLAHAVNTIAWNEWTVNQNYNYDLAFVRLDRLIGALTGTFGYGSNTDTFFWNTTFYNPGYPNTPPYNNSGLTMWTRQGLVDDVAAHEVSIIAPLYYGRHGAGIYNSSYTVYGVESHFDTTWNSTDFVRITSEKWTVINDYITGHTPTSYDLAVLDVNVSPDTIPAGSALTTLNMLIYNYSTDGFAGPVVARTYLSTNSTISPSDLLLDSRTLPLTLGPRSGVRANFTGLPTIPQPTAGGSYYIGTILDLADADNSNNTTGLWDQDLTMITQCNLPGKPGLSSPPSGGFTGDSTPYLDWTTTSDTSRYLVWVDNNSDWSSLEINSYASASNFTPVSALPPGKYYWSVSAENQAGGCAVWGSWSDAATFTIDTTPPNSIVDLIPSPVCPTSFMVRWSGYDPAPSSGGLRYTVQYRGNNGSWFDWLTNDPDTEAAFGNGSPIILTPNLRIDFRSKAIDAVGNTETYPTMPDSSVTVGRCLFLPITKK